MKRKETNKKRCIGLGKVAIGMAVLALLISSASAVGDLYAWGNNEAGQLGDGSNTNSNIPVNVGISVTAISAGYYHSLAIKTDGTVLAWGNNEVGQLGDGSNTNSNIPVQVKDLTDAIAISGGNGHSLALKSDGTVWAWGWNYFGQLGDGSNTNSNIPVQVITGAIAISGGNGHSLALKSDGTVWAWGMNYNGQLGDGSNTNSNIPVQVKDLTDAIAISAGVGHSLALKSDGTVWAWGMNYKGQLGDGSNIDSNIPVQVITGAIAISGGMLHSLALKSDGTVWAWGWNDFGSLGDGTNTDSNIPVQVKDLTGVIAIAGGIHSLAIKSDKSAWAWGRNDYGELGDGSNTDSNIPVQVSGISNVVAISGSLHSLALVSATSPNVAPIIDSLSADTYLTQINTEIRGTGMFHDSAQDTFTAVWNWDGSTNTIDLQAGSTSTIDKHTYTTPGVYDVSLTITDQDGASDTENMPQYIVVYDPNGGFVTGGGWINSPPGAYTPNDPTDPDITGRANFGFVSKYQKGATVPTGETEFQFQAGNLNFHSTSYDWLVVSGAKAQYKGSGTINGRGNYGFLLTATDGQVIGGGVDKFRIKIVDKDQEGIVVYDNVYGVPEDIDSANPQDIAGGSIVVHKK